MTDIESPDWAGVFQQVDVVGRVTTSVRESGPAALTLTIRRGQVSFTACFISAAAAPVRAYLRGLAPQLPFPYRGVLALEIQSQRTWVVKTLETLEIWVVRPSQAVHQRRVEEADRNARQAFAQLQKAQDVAIGMLGGVAKNIDAAASLVEVLGGWNRKPAATAEDWKNQLADALAKYVRKEPTSSGKEVGTLRRTLKTVRGLLPAEQHPRAHALLQDLDGLDADGLRSRTEELVEVLSQAAPTPEVERALVMLTGSACKAGSAAPPRQRRKYATKEAKWFGRWRRLAAGLRRHASKLPPESDLVGLLEETASTLEATPPTQRRKQADLAAGLSGPLLAFEPRTALELEVQVAGLRLLVHAIAAIPGVRPVVVGPGDEWTQLMDSASGAPGRVRRMLQVGWTDGKDGQCALVEVED